LGEQSLNHLRQLLSKRILSLSPAVQKKMKPSKPSNALKHDTCHFEHISNITGTRPHSAEANVSLSGDVVEWGGASKALSDLQLDIIEICVRASQAVGVPRSIGEIFGLIFSSARPVSFEDVVKSLGISTGSASHGLRKMCRLGIIRTCYVPRDRRDHYTVETSFRNVALALLEENMLVHVCWADERIERLRARISEDSAVHQGLASRIDLLSNWNTQARNAMKRALEALK
jgi:DNA-binding transcriptional regulator GbsR (MarR family)